MSYEEEPEYDPEEEKVPGKLNRKLLDLVEKQLDKLNRPPPPARHITPIGGGNFLGPHMTADIAIREIQNGYIITYHKPPEPIKPLAESGPVPLGGYLSAEIIQPTELFCATPEGVGDAVNRILVELKEAKTVKK